MPRERGDHSVAVIREGRARANQADLRVSQCPLAFCYKICALKSLTGPNNSDFGRSEASLPQSGCDHKWLAGAEFRGLVLNVPLSSVICR